MTEKYTETGTGWPEPSQPSGPAAAPDPRPDAPSSDDVSPLVPSIGAPAGDDPTVEVPPGSPPTSDADADAAATVDLAAAAGAEPRSDRPRTSPPGRRLTSAGLMIVVLLVLLGFTLVVQLKTTSTDPTLAATRQEDLVRILSDLQSQEERLRQEIAALEESQRQLASGAEGRQAALEEASRRADELGILAGTLPAVGPGLEVRFSGGGRPIRAATILDAVQELRGAGAEAMQISGGDGTAVRVIASTYFLDSPPGESGIVVDGRRLIGPYTITVIGDPATMRTALNIPGGVVASVNGDGGNVIVQEREAAEVLTLHAPIDLRHARPVS